MTVHPAPRELAGRPGSPRRRLRVPVPGGVGWMLIATAAFAVMTAFVKLLQERGLSTGEVMFWRTAPGLPWLWWVLRTSGISLRPRQPRLVALRCALGGAAMGATFWSAQGLSLVQHTVVRLAQPILVALASPLLLGERLRGRTGLAFALALLAALLSVAPWRAATAGEAVTAPGVHRVAAAVFAAVALLGAALSALAHISVRLAVGREALEPRTQRRRGGSHAVAPSEPDAPDLLVWWFAVAVTLGAGLVTLASPGGFGWPAGLTASGAALAIGGVALTGTVGQLAMGRAYALAPAPVVALIAYAGVPVSAALDIAWWGRAATWSDGVGTALMLGALALLRRGRSGPAAPAEPGREPRQAPAGTPVRS